MFLIIFYRSILKATKFIKLENLLKFINYFIIVYYFALNINYSKMITTYIIFIILK
jgi:hypothetical protein